LRLAVHDGLGGVVGDEAVPPGGVHAGLDRCVLGLIRQTGGRAELWVITPDTPPFL
jgi:hypothetical protein